MKPLELASWIAVLLVIFGAGFSIGKFVLPDKETVEKLVTIEKVEYVNTTCPVCVPVQCPVCDDKCYCKAMGGYAQDKVWWYQDNQTTGETP